KRRRRIDRSMIGEPTNFVHTAHIGSGELFSGTSSASAIQSQMQSKGGYGAGIAANVQ
ncbi:C42S2 protein, partial [Rhinopomastus cyanomelas]|nr:C42S2 protein [Rhinopomastus cyanomelas]